MGKQTRRYGYRSRGTYDVDKFDDDIKLKDITKILCTDRRMRDQCSALADHLDIRGNNANSLKKQWKNGYREIIQTTLEYWHNLKGDKATVKILLAVLKKEEYPALIWKLKPYSESRIVSYDDFDPFEEMEDDDEENGMQAEKDDICSKISPKTSGMSMEEEDKDGFSTLDTIVMELKKKTSNLKSVMNAVLNCLRSSDFLPKYGLTVSEFDPHSDDMTAQKKFTSVVLSETEDHIIISRIMAEDPVLLQHWEKLADDLRVGAPFQILHRQRLHSNSTSYEKLFQTMIATWANQESNQTVGKLCKILNRAQFCLVSDKVQTFFAERGQTNRTSQANLNDMAQVLSETEDHIVIGRTMAADPVLLQHWENLADDLRVGASFQISHRQMLHSNSTSYEKLFQMMIATWANQANNQTVGELCKILNRAKFCLVSDKVQTFFAERGQTNRTSQANLND